MDIDRDVAYFEGTLRSPECWSMAGRATDPMENLLTSINEYLKALSNHRLWTIE